MAINAEESLKILDKTREGIQGKITLFEKHLKSLEGLENGLTAPQLIELETRLANAEELLSKFDVIQGEIEILSEEIEACLLVREDFENKYFNLISKAKSILARTADNNSASSATYFSNRSISASILPGVKLPEIRLPKFDGSYDNWLEFRDIFLSLIHDNSNINNIQKFHYLRASLTGSAPQVIQSLDFSSENYTIAWHALCERYNNKNILIQNHLRSIFNLDHMVQATAPKIRFLYESLFKHLNCLNQLGEPTDHWDTVLIFIIAGKLDKNSTQEWEKHKSNISSVTLENFREFLKKRAIVLETIENNVQQVNREAKRGDIKHDKSRNYKELNTENSGSSRTRNNLANTAEMSGKHCYNCNGNHYLYTCEDFLRLGSKDRLLKVKALKLCMNCLNRKHQAEQCNVRTGCKICGSKHNTLLHERDTVSVTLAVPQEDNIVTHARTQSSSQAVRCNASTAQGAVLSTAVVRVGNTIAPAHFAKARVLLDCGSQSSFITRELCEKLQLPKSGVSLFVAGIADNLSYAKYKCDLNIQSLNSSWKFQLSCFVLDKITSNIPISSFNIEELHIPVNLQLADPNFYISSPIDILIGADAFWQLLSAGQINLGSNGAILQNTHLGWIVAGQLSMPVNTTICNLTTTNTIQDQLAKFWHVEEVDTKTPLSLEEQLCEEHFYRNLSTTTEGRYIVSIPFKDSPSKLGDSRSIALKRFLALERRLARNDTLRKLYVEFLEEYLRLGHMTEVTGINNSNETEYFLPHHGVLKEESVTTKLRVVFNASSKTSSGVSLNDLQMTGPIIQSDLLSIVLRFRIRPIVLSADIQKMYRQVLIRPDQRSLQQILWRSSPNEQIKTFKLNTVTYGTTAGSFLAIRCLHEVANECESEFPSIAKIIRNDMYVDDLLTSVNTCNEAKFIMTKLSEILIARGFPLRKWKSNNSSILKETDIVQRESQVEFTMSKDNNAKTLGLVWSSNDDVLTFKISTGDTHQPNQISKRAILSRIATIFDPLGLISPCVILAKVILQKLWAEQLTWDQAVPAHIANEWLTLSSELNSLNSLCVNRLVTCEKPSYMALHGFADASESSYGACLHILTRNIENEFQCNLLCAKSKVAPLKTITMPRLELCTALILARLLSKTLESIDINFNQVFCWSDSTIVLGWLKTPPNLLKTFVNSRVAEIQKLTSSFTWQHVSTKHNPADLVSRGLYPKDLMKNDLWWHGPSWLRLDEPEWPILHTSINELPEMRKSFVVGNSLSSKFPFNDFSSLNRLKRVTAYILRFANNSKGAQFKQGSYLTASEIATSFSKLLRTAQIEAFPEDYKTLSKKSSLPNNSKILSLHPFIDEQGLLRVGGRLTNSDYPYSKKHPILLSPTHRLTTLIFEEEHVKLLHAGPQLLLSSIRDTFWSIAGRNLAKKIVKNCVKCARYDPTQVQPIMGNLPEVRTRPTTPFTVVGVDYAGPFIMKDKKGRGRKDIKCWVSLFVCFVSRAIHLELVLSLSADDFIQAFHRFVSRRGKPLQVYSDNGTNFVKANKELKEFGLFLAQNQQLISESMENLNIKWHFIPTNSPHFGGLWEAGVKSMKYHLRRVLGNSSLFFFDFQTLLVRIEGILNSRPLFPLSSCPDDLTPLTPSHFLIGRKITAIPEGSVLDIPENRMSNYQYLQSLYEHFWKRWSREYISEIQQRHQWKKNQGNLEVGQMVLIKDDNLLPSKWRLGRILHLIYGTDGIARVASIKTVDGTVKRAFARLCPLPVVSQDFQGRGHVQYANSEVQSSARGGRPAN